MIDITIRIRHTETEKKRHIGFESKAVANGAGDFVELASEESLANAVRDLVEKWQNDKDESETEDQ
jgi:hypothetical protein